MSAFGGGKPNAKKGVIIFCLGYEVILLSLGCRVDFLIFLRCVIGACEKTAPDIKADIGRHAFYAAKCESRRISLKIGI